MNKLSSIALCVATAIAPVTFVSAQEDAPEFEKITVFSSFRNVNLAQLDASASILGQDAVVYRQASHIDELLNITPNTNFNTGASRGRFVQIRGIGERSQFAEPINPSVSFFVDAFDFSGLGAALLTFDTQQVEVFRGPQATLFGSGALAGAIRVKSVAPTSIADGFVDVQLSNANGRRLEAAYGNAVNDDARFRVAVLSNESDGFITNTFLQTDDTNNIDETAVKLAVDYDLSSTSQLSFQYRYFDIDNGYDAFSLDNDRFTRSDQPGFDRQETHALSAELNQELELGKLYVALTNASNELGYAYDEDWTFDGFDPIGYTSFDNYQRNFDTVTGEARLVGDESVAIFNDSTLWTVGAFFKQVDENLSRVYTFSSDFFSDYSPTIVSLYGQTQTQLSEKLRLEIGLRLEEFSFDYAHNEGVDVSDSTQVLGGKLSLSYSLNDSFIYGSLSRGYKAAGVNPDQNVSEDRRFFDTEYVWNIELGVKQFFKEIGLTSRFAVFHMTRDNVQVSDFDVQTRDDGSSEFIDIIGNAGEGKNQGVEAELAWQANEKLNIVANLGYLNASFEDYVTADGEVVDKQAQAQAPRWTGHFRASYNFNDALMLNVNMDMKDDYRFSTGHDVTSGFVSLFNSELSYTYREWRLALWGRNIFDREYATRGFGGFGNDPRNGYEPGPYLQLGNPRQFGISVRYTL